MMPHFTHPWALLLLALVPLAVWRFATRSRGAWVFSDHRLVPGVKSLKAAWAHWGGAGFRVSGLVLAILALAGPRWPDETRLETEGISIAMIVDVSVSMGEEDFAWRNKKITRLLGVKEIFRLFVAGGETPDQVRLAGRPHDAIALVTFATHPETACPLTLDHQALLQKLDEQQPRIAATEGTTNPGDAIAWALHVLQQAPTKRKLVVFLTDGESNVPEKLTPLQAAQLAANLSIPIYAIDAAPDPKSKEEIAGVARARALMRSLASMTQGRYFLAQDGQGLLEAYRSIDKVERERILSFQYRRFQEWYAWFALAALLCWLSLIALEATIWRRVP